MVVRLLAGVLMQQASAKVLHKIWTNWDVRGTSMLEQPAGRWWKESVIRLAAFSSLACRHSLNTPPFHPPQLLQLSYSRLPRKPGAAEQSQRTVILGAKSGGLGMLSCWERFGRRVESCGSAPTPSTSTRPPSLPLPSRSSSPACARGEQEHGARSDIADVAAEEKQMRHRGFAADSQPPGRQSHRAGRFAWVAAPGGALAKMRTAALPGIWLCPERMQKQTL